MKFMKDYLKYFKVVRTYFRYKYDLSLAELDMMLFLFSEKRFNKRKFEEYRIVIGWHHQMLKNLIKKGYVEEFRKGGGKYETLYQMSFKGKSVIRNFYNTLEGKEIPTSVEANPIFQERKPKAVERYRLAIIVMNREIRELRSRRADE